MGEKTVTVINLSSDKAPTFPKVAFNRSGWVSFGDKNLFPQEVINYNSKSPVNSSIVESKVTYICGKGVRGTSEQGVDNFVGVPNTEENYDDFIEKAAKDYEQSNTFYWQVIVNKGSTTVTLFHEDWTRVRVGKTDEKGKPLSFLLSNDWTKSTGKNKPVELPIWPGLDKAEKGVSYMYHYWEYVPGMLLYSVPGYYSAIEYVKADGTLGAFYNNSIDNGFTPSVVINMPSNPSEEKKAEFQKKMEGAFAGAKGASSIVILWGENDSVKPGITPFNASANADIYNNVEGIVFQKIVSAHRLASPTLAGVSGSGNLSGNAAEIIDAYVLFNYTVIQKRRQKILDKLNMFTKINGTALLEIDDLDVVAKIAETNNPKTDTAATPESAPQTLTRKNKLWEAFKKLFSKAA